jgi:hypothetical protein
MGVVLDIERAYLATGHGRQGILQSPSSGLAMAELILDGQTGTLNRTTFDPGRFSASNEQGVASVVHVVIADAAPTVLDAGEEALSTAVDSDWLRYSVFSEFKDQHETPHRKRLNEQLGEVDFPINTLI